MLSHKIMVLVAGAAFQSGYALSFNATAHIHRVAMPVVPLAGKVSSGMAVHAAWMMEHRDNGFKSLCRNVIAGCVFTQLITV
jgi:hypothetical protein